MAVTLARLITDVAVIPSDTAARAPAKPEVTHTSPASVRFFTVPLHRANSGTVTVTVCPFPSSVPVKVFA